MTSISTRRDPAISGKAVTPSDSVALSPNSRGIYVGSGGDLTVILVGDSATTLFTSVPTGTLLPIQCSYVYSTGTTATSIVSIS